jgi:metal-responsive CopG/Arc/MetJ family transcriptional regulator
MAVQLNIYIPKARADLVERLDRVSRESGRQKNELVLDALEAYLSRQPIVLGAYHMGAITPWKRGELYRGRLDRVRRTR